MERRNFIQSLAAFAAGVFSAPFAGLVDARIGRPATPASVAGVRFASALVDAACGSSCEDDLARLAEHGRFIVREEDAKWPDGTPVSQFRFRHAPFREVAYASLPAGRRSELHNRIGERLERGYDRRAPECSIELAAHYTAGHDAARHEGTVRR